MGVQVYWQVQKANVGLLKDSLVFKAQTWIHEFALHFKTSCAFFKTKLGLEDENGPSYVPRQSHAPPTSLLTSVNRTTNTCTTTVPGKIVGTYTLQLVFSTVSHGAHIKLPLRFFAFPFLVIRVYSFLDDHTTVEHKTQTWTFSF